MYKDLQTISLKAGEGSIFVENNPENFKGNIIKIRIEYFGTEIKYHPDKHTSFNEIPLIKGYSNPIYKEIHYNNRLKIIEKTKGERGFYPHLIYKYDSNNNLSKVTFPSEEGKEPFEKYIFEYNKYNQLVSKTKYRSGNFKWGNSYHYDEKGLLVKEIWHGLRDFIGKGLKFEYKYNSNKKLVSKISLGFYKILYEYDNKFRVLKIDKDINENNRGVELEKSVETFIYNEDGGFISNKINEIHKTHTKRIYNNNNELIEIYNEHYGITRFSYKYDHKNNWIYSVQYINNKPVLIIKRTFEYGQNSSSEKNNQRDISLKAPPKIENIKKGEIEKKKESFDIFEESLIKFKKGDFKGAILDLNEAIRQNPQLVAAYGFRGACKDNLGDFKGAILDFNEVIRFNPKQKTVLNNRGLSKMSLSDFSGCIQDCTQAIEIDNNFSYPYKHRGVAKYNLKDIKGALVDLNKAIELYADYKEALYHRGIIKNKLNDKKGACEDWNRAGDLGYFEANKQFR